MEFSSPADAKKKAWQVPRLQTREEMIASLKAMGFQPRQTYSKKWLIAWWARVEDRTLFVLIRKRGVDLLLTPRQIEEMLYPSGHLQVTFDTKTDRMGEYFYSDTNEDIHSNVLAAANFFVDKQPIDDRFFSKMGIGKTEWKQKYRPKPTRGHASAHGPDRNNDLMDVYDNLDPGDGSPVYMSDGMWLDSSGNLHED